jgi:hypothetical protein
MRLAIVNSDDRSLTKHRYVLAFTAGGWSVALYTLVWGNNLQDALDEAIDWIASHAPGLLATEYVYSEIQRLVATGVDNDTAWEEATQDMICGGNAGDYISSVCVHVVKQNPSRAELKSLIKQRSLQATV